MADAVLKFDVQGAIAGMMVGRTGDAAEGRRSFAEKRDPEYTGL